MEFALRRRGRLSPALAPPPIELAPIGVVRNRVGRSRPHGWDAVESEIVLVEAIEVGALDGLAGFSHLLVIFWLDRLGADRPRPARITVGDDPTPRGVLATRSQLRPNPLGCSAVRLLAVDERSLRVRGLDALDGTPVLDLKPYIPYYDAVADAAVPDWIYGRR